MGETIGDIKDATRQTLRQVLVAHYDALVGRLTRRLGSAELADDALHDAWLRLEREPDPAAVRDPFAYVLRVASNLASDSRERDRRRAALLGGTMLEAPPETLADDLPSPEDVVAARSDLNALKRAINSLPERRREIVLAAWAEQTSYGDLAARYGVTVRTIQIEVKKALAQCAVQIGRK